jgi:hypothetical protein
MKHDMADPGVGEQVVQLCTNQDAQTRAAAIRAAVYVVDPQRMEAILHAAESDPDPSVASAINIVRRRLAPHATRPVTHPTTRSPRRS